MIDATLLIEAPDETLMFVGEDATLLIGEAWADVLVPGTGGGGLAEWDEEVTYQPGSFVWFDDAIWTTSTESTGEEPGSEGAPWTPALNAGGVVADDEDHRPLTGTDVQAQLDRADTLLRFLNPGGTIYTLHWDYDESTIYYPGDAVNAFDEGQSKWYLGLCQDVPGAAEDGVVGEDVFDSDYWTAVCQDLGSGPVALRAHANNPHPDPITDQGLAAPLGSTLQLQDGNFQVGTFWVKTGTGDTDWELAATGDVGGPPEQPYLSRGTWDDSSTYTRGNYVKGSDDLGYVALIDDLVGEDPVDDAGSWLLVAQDAPIFLRSDNDIDGPTAEQTPAAAGSIMIRKSDGGAFELFYKQDGRDFAWGLADLDGFAGGAVNEDLIVLYGDNALGTTAAQPRAGIGIEAGGNDNAHGEFASPVGGFAYFDLTVVGVDARARVLWDDTNDEFRIELDAGPVLTFDASGNLTHNGTAFVDTGGMASFVGGSIDDLNLGTASESDVADFEPALGFTPEDAANKGEPDGYAELDSGGLVPTSQLPSYVDDVVTVANFAALPGTGETGKIYVTADTNLTYRWSGSAYVEISASLALGETSATAYRGDRGKTAYDHSQTTGNPHSTTKADIGLGSVDNTSDLGKPVSTAQAAADTAVASASVAKALYDANTILAATTDNTPAPLTVPASTFLGRKASGDIAAMSVAEANALLGGGGGAPGVFGDGSDGNVTISTTITLTRDMFYDTLTVQSGGELKTANFRVFCRTACIVDSGGTISNDGVSSAGTGGTAALAAGSLSGRGGTGGGGGATNGSNAAAVAIASDGAGGGAGGAGGSGASGPGGTGGAVTPAAATVSGFRVLPFAVTGFPLSNAGAVVAVQGGAGGGGGGGDGTSGGGGGSGAGLMILVAKAITNNGTIRAKGGNGFSPVAGNRGGGGGGGGGLISLVYASFTGNTVTAPGGTGGTKTGTGVNGTNGSDGVVVHLTV